MTKQYDQRHNGPYDCGESDAYYRRKFKPHYYNGTYAEGLTLVEEADMSPEDIEAYTAGYDAQIESGDFKDWG